MLKAQLHVRNLVARYGDFRAVDDVSFEVAEGEFVSLLGPSGCGKTTLLRCIAGLESIHSGEIEIGQRIVANGRHEVPPEKRGVNMVFQSYAVWPHMTVFQNVAYGLRNRFDGAEIEKRVSEALRLAGLSGLEQRYGTELSGGQQQRVAVARAVATEPQLLLFDEPLSNLDASLRERMRFELLQVHKRLRRTSLYVTHDQSEAMVMSDRIILMKGGAIVQVDRPRDLYERPRSRFAAEFLGNANLLKGTVLGRTAAGYEIRLDHGQHILANPDQLGFSPDVGQDILACVRPESIDRCPGTAPATNPFAATPRRVSFTGALLSCELDWQGIALRADLSSRTPLAEGSEERFQIDPAAVWLIPATQA